MSGIPFSVRASRSSACKLVMVYSKCTGLGIKQQGKETGLESNDRDMSCEDSWMSGNQNIVQVVPGRAGGGSFRRKNGI